MSRAARLTVVPAGFTVLALYGDQTVAEVWNRYQGRVVGRRPAEDHGARPWLPLELKLAAEALVSQQAAADRAAEQEKRVAALKCGDLVETEGSESFADGELFEFVSRAHRGIFVRDDSGTVHLLGVADLRF